MTVVSDCGKGARLRRQVGTRETVRSPEVRVAVDVSLLMRRCQNRMLLFGPGRVWRKPAYWPGGTRHGGDVNLVCCWHAERGKAGPDASTWPWWRVVKGRPSSGEPARSRVPTRGVLADRLVVAVNLLLGAVGAERRSRIVRGSLMWSTRSFLGGAA